MKRQIFIYINGILYTVINMKYVIVDEKGNIIITEDTNQVDIFLTKEDGLYHLITIYGKYVVHETFQVHNKKIYRIDAITF